MFTEHDKIGSNSCGVSSARPRTTPHRGSGEPGTWQQRFVAAVEKARAIARERMKQFAGESLLPVFDQLRTFTREHGLLATPLVHESDACAFKFSMSRRAHVLVTFRADSLECVALSEFSIPHHRTVSPIYDSVDLVEADEAWARRVFERALDTFAGAVADALATQRHSVERGEGHYVETSGFLRLMTRRRVGSCGATPSVSSSGKRTAGPFAALLRSA